MFHAFLNSLLNAWEWSRLGFRRLNLGEIPRNNQLRRRIRGPEGLLGHFAEK